METTTNWTAILFLLSLAVPFGWEAVTETGWRRYGAGALAAISGLLAIGWRAIEAVLPSGASAIAEIADAPLAWFVLFMFLVALVMFTGHHFQRPRLRESADVRDSDAVVELNRILAASIERFTQRISGIEQSLAELQSNKIPAIEGILRPRQGLLGTLLTTPDASRLDQLSEEISSVHTSVNALTTRVRKDLSMLSRAIRARDALTQFNLLDDEFGTKSKRLMRASTEDFADEGAWLIAYELWKKTANDIQDLLSVWFPDANSILDRPNESMADSPSPPANGLFIRTPSIIGYSHVHAVNAFYSGARNVLLRELRMIAQNLPQA